MELKRLENAEQQLQVSILLFLLQILSFFGVSGFWSLGKYRTSDLCFLLFFAFGAGISFFLYQCKSKLVKQWSVIHGLLALFWIIAMISPVTDHSKKLPMIAGLICYLAGAVFNGIGLKSEKVMQSIGKWCREHTGLFVLMAVFVILSLETLPSTPRGDSNTYFRMGFLYAASKFDFTLRNLSDFYLADHMAVGYAFLGLFGVFLDTKNAIGLHIVDIILILLSGAAFYELLGMFVQKAKKSVKVLATAVYLFHPLIFGMIASVSLDKPTLALMVLFTYLYLSDRRLLASFAGFLFLTTKEPNVAFYGAFMAAVYLVRFFGLHHAGFVKRFTYTFCRAQFVMDIIQPVIAAYLILATGTWASNNGIQFEYQVINSFGIVDRNTVSKNLQLGILNFNWLLLAGTVVFLVIVIFQYGIKRIITNRKFWTLAVPLGAMQLVFVGFQYIYYTYPNARYITPYEYVLTLGLGVLVLACNMKHAVKVIGMTGLALLLAVQSVVTIDPVTIKKIAHKHDGYFYICSTEENGKFNFNQTMEYNRQYTYWDGVLRKILTDLDTDQNILIGTPVIENTYFFAQFYPNWNKKSRMFEYTVIDEPKTAYYPVENCVLLNYGTVSEMTFNSLKEQAYDHIYMIVPKMYVEDADVQNTLQKAAGYTEKEYSYRGWNVIVYEVEISE